jgi:hypothetical protein
MKAAANRFEIVVFELWYRRNSMKIVKGVLYT